MPAIGTDTVTSVSRQFVFPYVVDQIYKSNPVFFRLGQSNRIVVQGGTQIEQPLMYKKRTTGGPYTGYDLIDTTPEDTVKNGLWNWKQYAVTVTVDGLTLIKTDHPDAIANFIKLKFVEAQHWLEDLLGTGLWSDGVTNTKAIDGLQGAVDEGTVNNTYAGITRSTDTWWKAQLDTATTILTLLAMRKLMGKCTEGSRHPTLIVSQQDNYDRFWNLIVGAGSSSLQRFPQEPTGYDEQLAKAGFTNLLFDGVPFLVDSHVNDAEHLYFLNETYMQLIVAARTNGENGFLMGDFQEPTNQDAMTAKVLWAGNLVVQNSARQGKFDDLTA